MPVGVGLPSRSTNRFQTSVHQGRVELRRIDRATDPAAEVLVLLVRRVSEDGEQVLVAPRPTDVLGWTRVGAVEADGELQAAAANQCTTGDRGIREVAAVSERSEDRSTESEPPRESRPADQVICLARGGSIRCRRGDLYHYPTRLPTRPLRSRSTDALVSGLTDGRTRRCFDRLGFAGKYRFRQRGWPLSKRRPRGRPVSLWCFRCPGQQSRSAWS